MLLAIALLPLMALASTPDVAASSQPTVTAEGRQVVVRVRLEVNEQGSADKCEIVQTDAPAKLADSVCPIMLEKARFTPAKDEAGKPKRSSMTQSVRFVLKD